MSFVGNLTRAKAVSVSVETLDDVKRAILRPVKRYPRTKGIEYLYLQSFKIGSFASEEVVALDFETRGTNWHSAPYYKRREDAITRLREKGIVEASSREIDQEIRRHEGPDHKNGFRIVGLGLSSKSRTVYIDLSIQNEESIRKLLLSIKDLPLIAHNVYFDSGVFRSYTGEFANFIGCTFGLYHTLSNEGFEGQSWGLKKVQKDMLGWKDTNEKKLDQWLVENGYVKGTGRKERDYDLAPYYCPKTGNYHKPDKGEMHRAPGDILGYYCALDADSCYQLYDAVLLPALARLPETVGEYHETFLKNVCILIEQQISGITVDQEGLEQYNQELLDSADNLMLDFVEHEDVSRGIAEWDRLRMEEHLAKEPAKYKKGKDEPKPPRDKEGNIKKHKKNGEISTSWLNYVHRLELWKKEQENPVLSKNWEAWNEKKREIEKGTFNIRSGDQKIWLYHTFLELPVVGTTDSGKPKVNKDTYKHLGESGIILHRHANVVKEQSYVEAALKHMGKDERIHPQFRAPGTLTGRLAGSGGLNMQQIPATLGYLRHYRPLPGKVWLDSDVKALEPTVLAEYSKDPGLLEVYGPGKINDIYLFFGANIPKIGDEFRACGYDPWNPTKESIKECKKKHKKLRSVCKIVHLAKSYGAGAWKIKQGLDQAGLSLPIEEVEGITDAWDETFRGVKDFERELLDEWRDREGWIVNGVGRPVCVAPTKLKDILNRFIQSTGHDVLMRYDEILAELLTERDIPHAWLISDFHDQFMMETDVAFAKDLLLTVNDAEDILNEELGGDIRIEFDPQWIENFAAAKVEDFQQSNEYKKLLTENGL